MDTGVGIGGLGLWAWGDWDRDGGCGYLLIGVLEELPVTDGGEHFREDLACEDGVFGICYFGDLFFFCLAGEAFCLRVLTLQRQHATRGGGQMRRSKRTKGKDVNAKKDVGWVQGVPREGRCSIVCSS